MGTTTRVKGDMDEKKPFNFALFWDKYGTFFILAIIVAIFGTLSSEYFLTTNNITQIFVQSSVTVLIGMGEFFAILVAGIDLSVGAILALSGMVTAKLMLAGVDPFLAALIGGVLVGGALGAINGCLVNWTGLHPFIITLGTNAIFRGITLVISDANSVYGFSFDFVNFFAATPLGIPVPVIFSLIVAVILWFLTTRMRVGRNIYALGGTRTPLSTPVSTSNSTCCWCSLSPAFAPGWRAWSPPRVSARRNRWRGWALKPTPSPAPSSAAPASSAAKDASSRWSSAV